MVDVQRAAGSQATGRFDLRDVSVTYGEETAIAGVTMRIQPHARHRAHRPVGLRQVHAAALPQPHERRARATSPWAGAILLDGVDIYGKDVDPVELRMRVGQVFQKPNPFPMSIYDNVAYGPRTHGIRKRAELDEIVEELAQARRAVGRGQGRPQEARVRALRRAAAAPVHRPRARDASPR